MPVVTLNPFDPVKTVATMLGSELAGCRFGCTMDGGLGAVEAAASSIPGFARDLNDRRLQLKSKALVSFRKVKSADADAKDAKRAVLRAKTESARAAATTKAAVASAKAQEASKEAIIYRARLERMTVGARLAEQAATVASKNPEEGVKLAAQAEAAIQTPVQVDIPIVKTPSIKTVLMREVPNPMPQVTMALVGSKEVQEMTEDLFAATVSPDYLAARAAAWEEVKDIVSGTNPFNQGWNFRDDTEWAGSGLFGLGDALTDVKRQSASAVSKTRKAMGLGDLGLGPCDIPGASLACKLAKSNTMAGKQCLSCGFDVSDKKAGAEPASTPPATPDPTSTPVAPPTSEYDPSLPWCDEAINQMVAQMTAADRAVFKAFSAWRPSHSDCPLCGDVTADSGGPDGGKQTAMYNGSAWDGAAYIKGGADGLTCALSWKNALKTAGAPDLLACPTDVPLPEKYKKGGIPKCNMRAGQTTGFPGGSDTGPAASGGISTGVVVGGLTVLAAAAYFLSR